MICKPQEPEKKKKESFWKRIWNDGSITGNVFNLISATLGAETLSLPYAFAKSGIILGIIITKSNI